MLKYISLQNVGPASSMRLDFSSRLNLLTGDNGLGKTLFLDMAWWALTGSWPYLPAHPDPDAKGTPRIEYLTESPAQTIRNNHSSYNFLTQSWESSGAEDQSFPGLVVYVQVDGGFSVWDPARTRGIPRTQTNGHIPIDSGPLHFHREDVWNGLENDDRTFCNGLIRDWVSWQYRKSPEFERLCLALKGLSPHEWERIEPGEPTRVYVSDARDIPTITLPYGTIPVIHASAGMRRIIALAYLLIWTLSEHQKLAKLTKKKPVKHLVLLVDEVEAHLHPQWQRVLLPALLKVIRALESDMDVQLIASSHAPLVLASLETNFNEEKDRIFNFELSDGRVSVNDIPWAKQGDVVNWLVSDAFGLSAARSREAEQAIKAAEAFMRGDAGKLPSGLETKEKIHTELLRVLPGHDDFWPRWIVHTDGKTSRPDSAGSPHDSL